MTLPILATARLELRPFVYGDVEAVARLAADREVASTTLTIPHPYRREMAEEWIATHAPAWERGTHATFAITGAEEGLVGAIGLHVQAPHHRAEIGYWVGRPYWGRGYCTEAGRALLGFAFDTLALHRVFAHHFRRNPASGRVMRKLGMRHEGCLRHHVLKWNVWEDLEVYGLLREEWWADPLRPAVADGG